MSYSIWANLELIGSSEEENEAIVVRDRNRNTIASPEWLETIVTCCLCNGPLEPGRRYVCRRCQS